MSAPASSTLLGMPPIPRTRLIGRETDRAAARAFVAEETVPLLTLTGPGGVGKTRLALAIASDVSLPWLRRLEPVLGIDLKNPPT
jgi:hypothetical protein